MADLITGLDRKETVIVALAHPIGGRRNLPDGRDHPPNDDPYQDQNQSNAEDASDDVVVPETVDRSQNVLTRYEQGNNPRGPLEPVKTRHPGWRIPGVHDRSVPFFLDRLHDLQFQGISHLPQTVPLHWKRRCIGKVCSSRIDQAGTVTLPPSQPSDPFQ